MGTGAAARRGTTRATGDLAEHPCRYKFWAVPAMRGRQGTSGALVRRGLDHRLRDPQQVAQVKLDHLADDGQIEVAVLMHRDALGLRQQDFVAQ